MKMLENNLIPRSFLLIVLASGHRYTNPSSTLSEQWADECRNLLVTEIFSRISTVNLQSLLLLQRFEWHRGAHLGFWFISGLAVRMSNALQLHLEPSDRRDANTPALPVTEMETRRRLIWSCFVMDSVPDAFHAGHRPIHSAINPSGVQARLPCDERSYERGLGASGGTLTGDPGSGPSSASAYLVRMVALRMKILHYAVSSITPHLASQFSRLPWEQGSKFYELCQELDQFKTSLPSDLLQPIATSIKPAGSIILHLTIHVMFHAASVDLFRIGTHLARRHSSNPSPPAPFVLSCRQSRIDHALEITQVVSDWMRNPTLEHDPFVAICSCVAIRVLVVERWDGNNELVSLSSQDVKDRLETCRRCALRTAQWSIPIRKLVCPTSLKRKGLLLTEYHQLIAISRLVGQHGFQLNLDDLPR